MVEAPPAEMGWRELVRSSARSRSLIARLETGRIGTDGRTVASVMYRYRESLGGIGPIKRETCTDAHFFSEHSAAGAIILHFRQMQVGLLTV